MTHVRRNPAPPDRWRLRLAVASGCLLPLAFAAAQAENLAGFYVGGAIGQSSIGSDQNGFLSSQQSLSGYSARHSAWAVRAGIRPISLLGAELEYADLGDPSLTIGTLARLDTQMKSTGAYGLLFLPIPIIDVYVKGGVASVRTRATLTALSCTPIPGCTVPAPQTASQTDASASYGAGLQFKLGGIALRGEYLRYSAAGTNPWVSNLGVSWSF
jgi:opacity protein-like surface antigen